MRRRIKAISLLATAGLAAVMLAYALRGVDQSASPPQPAGLALDAIVEKVELDAVPFEKALEMVKARLPAGVEMRVDWAALETETNRRGAIVSLHARDISLGGVLSHVIHAAAPDLNAGYKVDGSVIHIGLLPPVNNPVETRMFDVRDVLASGVLPPDETEGSDTGLYLGRPRSPMENLIKVVEDTVEPDSWDDNGGTLGKISSFGNYLVVTQTALNQRWVKSLLKELPIQAHDWPARPLSGRADPDRRPREAAARLRTLIVRAYQGKSTLREAIRALSTLMGLDIFVNWTELAASDDRIADTPVSFEIRGATLIEAITAILDSNDRLYDLKAAVTINGLEIYEKGKQQTCFRTYDVRKLVEPKGAVGRRVAWAREANENRLLRLCTTAIDAGNWQGGYGGVATTELGILYVRQTWQNQQKVTALLERISRDGLDAVEASAVAGGPSR